MKTAAEFIVLNSVKYGEKSLVLQCLCRDLGRRSFFVRSAASVASLIDPMSVLEGSVVESPHFASSMPSVTSLSRRVSFPGIRSSVYKSSITMFMAEVIYRTMPEGVAEDGVYDWCVGKLALLEALDKDFGNYPLIFLMELSVNLGFRPRSEDIAPFVSPEHIETVHQLMSLPFAEAMLVPLSGRVRNSISDSLLRYMELHLDTSLNIKSLPILRELMECL